MTPAGTQANQPVSPVGDTILRGRSPELRVGRCGYRGTLVRLR